MYASSDSEYRSRWNDLVEKYNLSHGDCVQYLTDTYITNHSHRFVKCFTNQVLHFDTTVTSRGESGHAALKRQLDSSTGDLKTVVDGINILLVNQHHNHLIAMNEAKIRYPTELRKPIFQNIASFVSPVAIRKILPQYQMLTDQHTAITRCIGIFTIITKLPCSHKIQKRLYAEKNLFVENIHLH